MSLLTWFHAKDESFSAAFDTFMSRRSAQGEEGTTDIVRAILQDVKNRGDAALFDYTQRFDKLDIDADTMRISQEEIDAAHGKCSQKVKDALSFAAERITDYHQRQVPNNWSYHDDHNNMLGMRWSAVERAGIYVPGGKASYPSSVLMNALPARAAGVDHITMVVPTPNGEINPAILVAAKLCGINEIYRIGGAHAVAALAFGTQSIQKVDVIVGPGNQYVAEAKRQLFGVVGIDMVAGPSEILVVADGSVNPRWAAADMLSQAEHDELAQSIMVCTSADYAWHVETEMQDILSTMPRKEIAEKSLQAFGAMVVARDAEDACDIANLIAAEHLELLVEDTAFYQRHIRHAGAIFIGAHTPEAIGDYVAGPSHVLPTTQTAHYASGLSVYHFMKKTSLIECNKQGFDALAEAASALAECEGLSAHQLSVDIRKG